MTGQDEREPESWTARTKLAFVVFATVGAFFLVAEHRAHVLPLLPWLLVAACPLMHLVMHGSHHGHGSRHASDRRANAPRRDDRGPGGHPHDGGAP